MAARADESDRRAPAHRGLAAARGCALALLAVLGWLPLLATGAEARTVTVRWTHGSPHLVTGFRLYTREEGHAYGAAAFQGLPPLSGGVYAAQVTVPDGVASYVRGVSFGPGGESGPSNEVRLAPVVSSPVCGNGVRESGEACDDGNRTAGDGCRASCTIEVCGDLVVDAPREQCDDGNATNGDGCESCLATRVPACGDGVRDPGEGCDDGNRTSGDGCRASCTVEVCGDRIVDAPREQCDDGNATAGDGCESCRSTRVPACGDGVRDPGEACDDGNAASGDGCRPSCTLELCGDGVRDPREACDDGNAASGDGCDAGCVVSACGNGVVAGGEGCDDGNATSGDGCDANCTPTGCGNGVVGAGESCDDGNSVSGDGCDANCTPTACGNGVTSEGELCDDGNLDDGDGCSAFCELQAEEQTAAQVRCILAVNRGVARVAEAQARAQARCLEDAARGALGEMPDAFDACLGADLHGRVAEAEQALIEAEAEACLPEAAPGLALGEDRLTGLAGASELPAAGVRDLFGAPDAARAVRAAASGARCQREVMQRANGLFGAVWDELLAAAAQKLEGRRGLPAATHDAELALHLETVAVSPTLARRARRFVRHTARACEGTELAEVVPGCAPAHTLELAACAVETTRCRACELLRETNPRLAVDCDGFDDLRPNGSCAAAE